MTSEPKVTTKIDWKNFFLVFFMGTALIAVGIVVYYQFEFNKLTAPTTVNFSPNPNSNIHKASPSSEVATSSAQETNPLSGN